MQYLQRLVCKHLDVHCSMLMHWRPTRGNDETHDNQLALWRSNDLMHTPLRNLMSDNVQNLPDNICNNINKKCIFKEKSKAINVLKCILKRKCTRIKILINTNRMMIYVFFKCISITWHHVCNLNFYIANLRLDGICDRNANAFQFHNHIDAI